MNKVTNLFQKKAYRESKGLGVPTLATIVYQISKLLLRRLYFKNS